MHFTFGGLIHEWRSQAGLSQQELADLTAETIPAAEAANPEYTGRLSPLIREKIAQYEGDKVKHPTDRSLIVLTEALAEGLRQVGFDADAATLYMQLRAALRPHVMADEVSRQAAELDAVLQTVPDELRAVGWETVLAAARAFRDGTAKRFRA